MDAEIELGMVRNSLDVEKYNPFHPDNIKGKDTIIHDYCKEHTNESCIWICMRSRGKWVAKDIPVSFDENQTLGVYELRKICGWWKRHSLYSATGVKEVMIRFIDFDETRNEIGVAIAEFNYERLRNKLDESIEMQMTSQLCESGACGVDALGQSHGPNEHCDNAIWDGDSGTYCPVQYSRQLSIERDNYAFLPSMLEYYWQNGIKKDGLKFLESSKFVTKYESLKTDVFLDAANPYGKTVYAFKLVEGWRVRYLLCLVAASLVCSICVIGVATAAHQSIEAGLTAGSYALGLAAVLLGVMTFLSAVL